MTQKRIIQEVNTANIFAVFGYDRKGKGKIARHPVGMELGQGDLTGGYRIFYDNRAAHNYAEAYLSSLWREGGRGGEVCIAHYTLRHLRPIGHGGLPRCLEVTNKDTNRVWQKLKGKKKDISYFFWCVARRQTAMFTINKKCELTVSNIYDNWNEFCLEYEAGVSHE